MPRSYDTNLRKGRIENPGYEKIRAIARVLGFPPEAWFEDAPGRAVASAEGRDLAARVGHLFATIRHPGTGEPHTNAEVARMSAGGLTEEEVERMRSGAILDPAVGQLATLAAATKAAEGGDYSPLVSASSTAASFVMARPSAQARRQDASSNCSRASATWRS